MIKFRLMSNDNNDIDYSSALVAVLIQIFNGNGNKNAG